MSYKVVLLHTRSFHLLFSYLELISVTNYSSLMAQNFCLFAYLFICLTWVKDSDPSTTPAVMTW